ncbi:hypothetical protein ABTZ99_22920 [Actinosynnema sp. NPDC002837]
MTVSKPVLNFDDLLVETIGVVPAAGPEELVQGHGLTELGASSEECDDDCDRGGSCGVVA